MIIGKTVLVRILFSKGFLF